MSYKPSPFCQGKLVSARIGDHLFWHSSHVVEALSEDNKHLLGSASERARRTVERSVACSEHDHCAMQLGQLAFAAAHSRLGRFGHRGQEALGGVETLRLVEAIEDGVLVGVGQTFESQT